MKEIKTVKSQEELNSLGNYSGPIIISFGTIDNHAILNNTFVESIEIQNDSVVDINNVNPDSLISIKDDQLYIFTQNQTMLIVRTTQKPQFIKNVELEQLVFHL